MTYSDFPRLVGGAWITIRMRTSAAVPAERFFSAAGFLCVGRHAGARRPELVEDIVALRGRRLARIRI